jgi:hypothetical protein
MKRVTVEKKTVFINGFENGSRATSELRKAVYEQEVAWINSLIELYE